MRRYYFVAKCRHMRKSRMILGHSKSSMFFLFSFLTLLLLLAFKISAIDGWKAPYFSIQTVNIALNTSQTFTSCPKNRYVR